MNCMYVIHILDSITNYVGMIKCVCVCVCVCVCLLPISPFNLQLNTFYHGSTSSNPIL